jgi:hypothetical protein
MSGICENHCPKSRRFKLRVIELAEVTENKWWARRDSNPDLLLVNQSTTATIGVACFFGGNRLRSQFAASQAVFHVCYVRVIAREHVQQVAIYGKRASRSRREFRCEVGLRLVVHPVFG